MGKAERERAKAALEHALAALGDGAGREIWGPGVVGQKLWEEVRDKREPGTGLQRSPLGQAGVAFDTSAQVAYKMGFLAPAEMYAAMRKIAPVLLEVLLGEEE